MLSLIIRLSALSFGLCYATLPSAHLPPSQALTSLNERMNEMINALYASSPVLSKLKEAATATATKSTETSTATDAPPTKNDYEQYYQVPVPISAPQILYLPTPPTQKTLEAGVQPTDYAYPILTNPVPRSVFPPISFPMPTPYPTVPYPCEYPHLYPEHPVFPTPYLPPVTFSHASPVFAPCHVPATASFPPTTPFAPATPSYAPAPPSFPMTSYQSFPGYQTHLPPNYQQAPTHYSPPAAQGETNAAKQYS